MTVARDSTRRATETPQQNSVSAVRAPKSGPAAGILRLQASAGNRAVVQALRQPRSIRRMPADFAKTKALTLGTAWEFNLQSGWGLFGYGPWDSILASVRTYAGLRDDQYEERTAGLTNLLPLINGWEAEHRSAKDLSKEDKEKAGALKTLRALIDKEHRELAAAATVDENSQSIKAPRFKGDYMLEQVLRGQTSLVLGDRGPYVTKAQQALADTSHLASDKVTGEIDASTETAVKAFQKQHTLPESGKVDKPTMGKLDTLFLGHSVEKTLAQAPSVGPKSGPGEFAWGSAPAELTGGTRDLGGEDEKAAKEAVKTSQKAGPSGTEPAFVSNLPGKGTYEVRLKALVLALVENQYNWLAKGKAAKRKSSDLLDWAHIETVAARSKQETDAAFGKFAVGPPLKHGAGIHDAWDHKVNLLKDPTAQESAANWRVEKLLTGHKDVRALDLEHGAIQSRDAEKKIVEKVKAEIVAAKRDDLLEIHKAWPAFASGGEVNIQRFKATTDAGNRDEMWHLFQTVVHEYLHTLEHSRYKGYQSKLEQQAGAFTLREGVVEYFTYTVLESVTYDDALRTLVEGTFHDSLKKHPIPKYGGYSERANAEKLAGTVGARNVMAAFFLGDVEKIGGNV
jgi:peptidoglycan hydrolase-like protein with peptidoglycan-binding domain